MKILLIVNPISGIGGAVGLKGSDGVGRQREAIKRGATPRALDRTKVFLEAVNSSLEVDWRIPSEISSTLQNFMTYDVPDGANKTREVVRRFGADVDLIVFVGGDGTARDVLAGLRDHARPTLCLGIPAGVKMHSGVFAVSPQAAAKIVNQIIAGELVTSIHRDIHDYDDGEESIVRYGELPVPEAAGWLQQTKVGGKEDEGIALEEIVADVMENLQSLRPLVLGPGSTMLRIKEALGFVGTLRGFDILEEANRQIDVGEEDIVRVARNARFVVSFAKDQGFLIGRGNQQFSAAVLREIDFAKQVTIVATRTKILSLAGNPLLVDTGDAELDKQLSGVYEITSGYEDRLIYRVEAASG